MTEVMRLYLDDSGTRHPDRDRGQRSVHGYDWFGLGGVLIHDRDVDALTSRYRSFCAKWNITYPLHSAEIRSRVDSFRWLRKRSDSERAEFFADVGTLVTSSELTATACVIDRPGYNHRYRERYGHVDLPGAMEYYGRTLSLPLFPAMTEGDVNRVVDVLAEVIGA